MNRIGPIRCLIIFVMLATLGCNDDEELTRMQSDVARSAARLVEQDALARREIIGMQAALDKERRLIAERERRDPIIAQVILQIGSLLLCVLPLVVTAWLLLRSHHEDDVTVLDVLLIDEVVNHEPQRLDHRDLDSLVQDRLTHQGE